MLNWPMEYVRLEGGISAAWSHGGSNLCLDFHGDPRTAKLVVFSDGNHHMALEESLQGYADRDLRWSDIFYVTTPPGTIVAMLERGRIQVGNLRFSVRPHLVISPHHVMDKLAEKGLLHEYHDFVSNRGNVLLVARGNPAAIQGAADLLRDDVRVFISSPEHETVSYQAYLSTLENLCGGDVSQISFVHGERIHHREAPQVLADGKADVAIVFYHLALRYTRIFPDLFDIIPLGGTADDPQPLAGNVISKTAIALVPGGETAGNPLMAYLQSDEVTEIYRRHGLERIN